MEFMSSLQGGNDELKPSLFELLSEQQLASLLPPSLRYLLAVATHRHPRYLLRVLNSFDEVYAVLMLLVERYYLRTHGGGFTENFYGLKRARVPRIKGGSVPRAQFGAPDTVRDTLKLRERDVWMNLAVMVGLPYLKRKLDESYSIHAPQATMLAGPNFGRDELPQGATIRQRILYYYKWFLRKVYPSVNAAYYFALLAFNLAYLFDNSKYHNPFFWLIGTRVRRLSAADYRAIAEVTEGPTTAAGKEDRAKPWMSMLHPLVLAQTAYPRMLSTLKILLPTSIFALKFLEWWHASDFARQLSRKAAEGLELPPPIISGLASLTSSKSQASKNTSNTEFKQSQSATKPQLARKPPTSASSGLPILTVPPTPPDQSSLCPICLQPVTTATVTPYGYVYCYTCIHKWIEGMHERQEAFMEGGGSEEGQAWTEELAEKDENGLEVKRSRQGAWESGKGRCAVSGKRVLGGTGGLRRVVV